MVLGIDGLMPTGEKISCTKLFLTISSLLTGHALGHGEEFVKWSASSICSCPQALRRYTASYADQIAGEYVILQKFLNDQERRSVMTVAKSAASGKVGLIDDREIDTSHTCIRFEFELRQKFRQIYDKLLNGIQIADCSKWCLFGSAALPKNTTIFPEIEFITYEYRDNIKTYLEPHVDNDSVLTLIVMLSDPRTNFTGGKLLFEHFDSNTSKFDANCYFDVFGNVCHRGENWRSVHLDIGDAVLFRGSQVEHTITPLLSGTRSILQIEMSVDGFDDDDDDGDDDDGDDDDDE